MDDRDRSDAPTAVERPAGGSAPASDGSFTDPSISPIGAAVVTSAFDPPRDRFEIRTELGRGGMGRVDEAFDHALGRSVAIKHMLSPSGTALARFEREARITARLEHPGIVPIHDAGRSEDGTPYYVMRRVDGRPLSEITRGKTLDERLALVPNILAACDAVAFAHARGIIHRDIKPPNILIGPFGETLVIDWGIAREIGNDTQDAQVSSPDSELTRAGTVAGTAGFMSPEQARGEGVDARADVFGLGVTLFYVITGELPWGTARATEMIAAVGSGGTPQWSLIPDEVPDDLRAIIEKAMASDAAVRYPDAGALATDLRRFITGNLVGAYQYGRMARVVRFARRHRAAVAVALIGLVLLAVVATVSVRRVIEERDRANAARALAELRQREATDVADGYLVDTARQLATTDPIAAIAKLRQLAPASRRWRDAWAAASTAWLTGIPFGFVTEPGSTKVQVSSDNRHAFVANYRTGAIAVIDLARRERRMVVKLGPLYGCSWFDVARSIACSRGTDLIIIDVETKAMRTVLVDVAILVTDRTSRMLIQTKDNRVLELQPSWSAPVEIARDVTDLEASMDLEWIVLERGSSAELRHRDQSWPLPFVSDDKAKTVFEVRDGTVITIQSDQIRAFQVVGAALRATATTPRPQMLMTVASAGGNVYVLEPTSVSMLNGNTMAVVQRTQVQSVFSTPTGFVVASDDGKLMVRDAVGWFSLVQRPRHYRMLEASSDGRFVLALDDGADLLVWDLDGVRGTTLSLGRAETVGELSDTDLWTSELGESIHRHPLATGGDEVVLEHAGLMARFEFDQAGRWVATSDNDHTTIYDVSTKRPYVLPAIPTNLAFDSEDVVFGMPDATLWRWTPASGQPPAPFATLPAPASFLAQAPGFVLAVASAHDVMRLQVATKQLDRTTVADEIESVVTENDGRAWLLGGGAVWRWDIGGTPVKVETAEPVRTISAFEHGVLLQGTKALTLQEGGQRRLLTASTSSYRLMSDDLLAVESSAHRVSVIDMVTAQTVELPIQTVIPGSLVASGLKLGFMTASRPKGWLFTYWDLRVPREPAALQRWLTTVTNAKPIAGSDAIAWPSD